MRSPLTPTQQALVEQYRRLAFRIASRHCLWQHPAERDDLKAEALLALCEAARDFDPARGFCFSTYAYKKIAFKLQNYRRDYYLAGFCPSQQATAVLPLSLDYLGARERMLLDRVPDPSPGPEARLEWLQAEAELRPREREIAQMVLREDLTFREIGQRRGVTGPAIGKALRAVGRRLQRREAIHA